MESTPSSGMLGMEECIKLSKLWNSSDKMGKVGKTVLSSKVLGSRDAFLTLMYATVAKLLSE